MKRIRGWLFRLGGLFSKARREREFAAELESHLQMHIEDNLRAGMTLEEARRQGLIKLGGVEQTKERYRDRRGIPVLEALVQDLTYGVRQLRHRTGLTAVVVLSLALGIGANTAIFSLMDAVMIRMLPVKNPGQLQLLEWSVQQWPTPVINDLSGSTWQDKIGRTVSTSFSYPTFQEFHRHNRFFASVFGFADFDRVNVNIKGQAGLASPELVTGDYFSGLGVRPILGREITPADEELGAPPVVVLSYRYWQNRLGGDPSVVGKAITIDQSPFTIIGVAPPEFYGVQPGSAVDLWLPASMARFFHWVKMDARDQWWLLIMGRLKPGVDASRARAGLTVPFEQGMTAGMKPPPKPQLLPELALTSASKGLNDLRQEFSKPLWILMALVGLVLLIACANVANLLLARAATRQKEIAVRLAVGAGRRRLIRQLLTESLLLAAMGGALGLLLAFWGTHLLIDLISSGREPLLLNMQLDWMVLGFTAAVSVFTGILFGIAPAFRATRVNLTPALKENPGNAAGRHGTRSFAGKVLVTVQIAMCLFLLIGAGLFLRTLENLENQNLGFNRYNLLTFAIAPMENGYKGARLATLYEQLLARLQALPGVRSASLSQHGLIDAGVTIDGVLAEGSSHTSGEGPPVYVNALSPGFLRTTGIKLLLGRNLGTQDNGRSPNVALANQAMAQEFFGHADPIGRRFSFGKPKSAADETEIVGIVDDAKYGRLRGTPPPTVYLPYRQKLGWMGAAYFEVRTAGPPLAMVPAVRRTVQSLNRNLPLAEVKSETQAISESIMQERLFARLSTFFGALALLLACVGVYGVLNYAVARRRNEIGIRMALGAQRTGVLWMVLRETLILIGIGLAIGVPCALAAGRLVSSIMFGINATDPPTIIGAAVLLSAVALLAGYLPARRASRVDPMAALRHE